MGMVTEAEQSGQLQLNQGREYGWNVSRGTRTERKDE